METRKIYVVDTRREKSIIMTGAETLGELKSALTENGIEYDGMTFFEGYSAVELKDDSSQLPTNVKKRNGETTNELLIMITNSSTATCRTTLSCGLVPIGDKHKR